MKSQDSQRKDEFLRWVAEVYGDRVRQLCEERIAQLPPDEEFDPLTFVSDAFCEDYAETIEVVDQMSRSPFRSRLKLK